MTIERISAIRIRLEDHLSPSHLEIIDDGHKHIGHSGSQFGGHFTVKVTSDILNQKSTLEAHRAIYQVLDDLMNTEIHALSIQLINPYA
ncbi:MAG: hypothetical protein LEGION0398_MBIBDBAK_00877 [Legionellaceae bacterium]